MNNNEINHAWEYHNETKHSYLSIRTTPHFLDWANMPLPFKIYPDILPVTLPHTMPATQAAVFDVISAGGEPAEGCEPTLDLLASVLYYSAGVTKKKSYPGGTIYFRGAACAGALYPIEVYVVSREIDGLAAGVYHFNPGDFALRRLRDGDFVDTLIAATDGEERMRRASVVLVLTAISWRSSWKYRSRAYRYHYWDAGMILANALAISRGHQMDAGIVMGFVESEVSRLIGIGGRRELALALLPLGRRSPLPAALKSVPELALATVPLSESEVDYPSIYRMHEASSLGSRSETGKWREGTALARPAPSSTPSLGPVVPVSPAAPSDLPRNSIEEVVLRRASSRRFARRSLPLSDFSTILHQSTRGLPSDFVSAGEQFNDLYIIVNRVEGMTPGSYFLNRAGGWLEQLEAGEFSEEAAHLVLDQQLGGDAAATVFFMVDLDDLLRRFGNRGYRLAQMEAGLIGGKAYLAAYALGRGATGLTFYDDDVTRFFSPHATGKICTLAMSFGIAGKKPLY
jgi:SagB-type dehydrogenase family enzyme